MKKHNAAGAEFLRSHQRRTVAQPRPNFAFGVEGGRIGQNLPVNIDFGRHGEAEKRAILLERRQLLRCAPRQRAAERPAALAQTRGAQIIAALFHVHAGKADQQAALFDPALEARLHRLHQPSDIGQHHHRGLLFQQRRRCLVHIARLRLQDLGEGRERFLDIMSGRQQRLRHRAGFTGNDPGAVPEGARIQQKHRAGRCLAGDFQLCHLILQRDRQIQRHLCAAAARSHRERRRAEMLAPGAEGRHRAGMRISRGQHARRELPIGVEEAEQAKRAVLGRVAHQRQAAAARSCLPGRLQQFRRIRIVHAIAEPDHGEPGGGEAGFQGPRLLAARRRHWQRFESGGGVAGLLRRQRLRLPAGGQAGGRRNIDRLIVAFGAPDDIGDVLLARLPAACGRPVVIDQQQHGTPVRGGALLGGVEWLGQRQDDQRGGDDAQGGEPPGAAGGRALGGQQPRQQPGRRKHDARRRRRHEAQQPPDQRQRQQPGQQPGRGETEKAGHHGASPPAAARGGASSTLSAGAAGAPPDLKR